MVRRRVPQPFHGARVDRQPRDLRERCAAYLTRGASGQFFSHATAAQLLGLPLPNALLALRDIHVAVVEPATTPELRGVISHTFDESPGLVRIHDLPVVNSVDTWMHLAAALSVPELVVVGDHLVRKKRPLARLADLHAAVAASAGRRNVRKLRAALDLIRPLTASPKETELRLLILAAGLPEPAVGYEVRHDGYWVGTPDLAYPAERVAIEYEGDVHRLDLRTFRDDIDRRERFEDAGWRVIRITADQLDRPHPLTERIRRALASRAQPRAGRVDLGLPSRA